MRVFSFIEKNIYKTTSEEDCVRKTMKRSTRQQISYSVFTMDMTLCLYSSEGFIHHQKKKYLLNSRTFTGLNACTKGCLSSGH